MRGDGRRGKELIFIEHLKYIQLYTVKVQYKNFRLKQPGFESQFSLLLAVRLRKRYLNYLSLSVLICKMEINPNTNLIVLSCR